MANGTVICGIGVGSDGCATAHMAAALSTRLGLRLVLAHVVDAVRADDSFALLRRVESAEAALVALAGELPSKDAVEVRVEVGHRAEVIAQLAAEEGADLVVLGSRPRRLRDRWLRCRLARDLETLTPAPILVAPPQTRRRSARRLAAASTAWA